MRIRTRVKAGGGLYNHNQTIEESLAWSVARMGDVELQAVARRAHRRGFRQAINLIRGEFRRRRALAVAA